MRAMPGIPRSGLKGFLLAIFIGSTAAAPLYAAFPVAAMIMRKGISFFNLMLCTCRNNEIAAFYSIILALSRDKKVMYEYFSVKKANKLYF